MKGSRELCKLQIEKGLGQGVSNQEARPWSAQDLSRLLWKIRYAEEQPSPTIGRCGPHLSTFQCISASIANLIECFSLATATKIRVRFSLDPTRQLSSSTSSQYGG